MRIVTAVMRHETNTFSPLPTPLSAFGRGHGRGLVDGQAAIDVYGGTNSPVAAYLDWASEIGADLTFPVAGNANPSGPVTDDAFETMSGKICDAVAQGCDVVLLDLHGAMVVESHTDGEGELLRRIREVDQQVPIAVALDFHTNLSSAMIDNADIVTGYCTYPHVDMYETGARAVRTMKKLLADDAKPSIAWRHLPMLTHMLRQTPAMQPMKAIMERAQAAEADGRVLNASIFGGFPLADIPETGLSVVIVGEDGDDAGETLASELASMAWDAREGFVFEIEPMTDSIARAKAMRDGPVILVDHGDNTGAGGNQDVMAVLEEVIAQELDDVVAGPIWDPASVQEMIAAGVGADVTLRLGGKTDMPTLGLTGKPLQVSGRVRRITDGRFTVTGPMMTGLQMSLGPTAVLDTGRVEIVVSSGRYEPFDVGCFTHAGIDPSAKRYVLIKSRQHFRAGFEPIAKDIVLVAGPGVCTSDYSLLDFKHLKRPIYPLEPDTEFLTN